MKAIYPAELYQLLRFTQSLEEKTVLDCGAGGRNPPLGLFHEYGFKTIGIDISLSQIEAAKEYEKTHGINLNIIKGNMLDLEFSEDSFSCVYSFNSSVHLSKKNTRKAVAEMLRVLKPGGVMYINFIWEPAKPMYLGEERAPGECWMMGRDGEEVLHTLFSEEETRRAPWSHYWSYDLSRPMGNVCEILFTRINWIKPRTNYGIKPHLGNSFHSIHRFCLGNMDRSYMVANNGMDRNSVFGSLFCNILEIIPTEYSNTS